MTEIPVHTPPQHQKLLEFIERAQSFQEWLDAQGFGSADELARARAVIGRMEEFIRMLADLDPGESVDVHELKSAAEQVLRETREL